MARRRPTWTVTLEDGTTSNRQTFDSEYQATRYFTFLADTWTDNAREMPVNHVERTSDECRIVSDVTPGRVLVSIEVHCA